MTVKKKHLPFWLIISVLVMGIGMIVCPSFLLYQWIRICTWHEAKGRVVTSRLEKVGRDNSKASIVYEYSVDGQTYRSSRPFFGYKASSDYARHKERCLSYPAGKEGTVCYHPNDPTKAIIKTGNDWFPWFLLMSFGLLALWAGFYHLFDLGRTPPHELKDILEPLAEDEQGIWAQLARQKIEVYAEMPGTLTICVGSGRSTVQMQSALIAMVILGYFIAILLYVQDVSLRRYFFLGLFGLLEFLFFLWFIHVLCVAKKTTVQKGRLMTMTRLGPFQWSKTLMAEDIDTITYDRMFCAGEIKYYDIKATLQNQREVRLANHILGEDRVAWLTERIKKSFQGPLKRSP